MSYIKELLAKYGDENRPHIPEEIEFEGYPLVDMEDKEILMHREVHFGRSFGQMLAYYDEEKKGAVLDFRRVRALASMEERSGQDVAPMILTPEDALRVRHMCDLYETLRDAYEGKEKSKATLLADLILSEEEEEEAAMEAIITSDLDLLEELHTLLRSDEFADTLYPGYGYAPSLAARTLGRLGSDKSVIPLFEALTTANEELEEEITAALRHIGGPAKQFLVNQLYARPLTADTERSAAILSSFPHDETIVEAALTLLQQPEALPRHPLASYLVLACEGAKELQEIKKNPALSPDAKQLIDELG